MKKVVPLFIAHILITSVLVTAAGRATLSNPQRGIDEEAQARQVEELSPIIEGRRRQRGAVINERTRERNQERQTGCEEHSLRRDRIRCRLERQVDDYTEGDDFSAIPEACRKIPSEQGKQRACIALYKRSASCYEKSGEDKDRCFRQAIGQTKKTMRRANSDEKRNYLILLLYDLQERVGNSYDAGKIDEDTTAEIIDLIVEIKQKILDQEPRSEIKAATGELKSRLKAARPNGSDMKSQEEAE